MFLLFSRRCQLDTSGIQTGKQARGNCTQSEFYFDLFEFFFFLTEELF